MKAELKELMDTSTENARLVLRETKCKEALINYELVKTLCEVIKQQDASCDQLANTCIKASNSIIEHKKFINVIKDNVSESMWHLFENESQRGECACL